MRRCVAAVVLSGQGAGGKEALLSDLHVRRRHDLLGPIAHDEQGHVIAGKPLEVGVDAEQLGGAGERDPRLLLQLARERAGYGLALLDASARKMPAGLVAVAHQQHTPVVSRTTACAPMVSPRRKRQ